MNTKTKKRVAKSIIYGPNKVGLDIVYEKAEKKIDKITIAKTFDHLIYRILSCAQRERTEDIRQEVDSLVEEIYELSKSCDIEITDKIKAHVKGIFEEYSVSETEQKDIWFEFSTSIINYLEKNNPSLANDIELKEQIEQLRKEPDEIFPASGRQKMLTEYLDQKCQSSLSIANVKELKNRREDIDRINEAYRNQKVVFIYGEPGIGKTTLAKQYSNTSTFEYIFFLQYDKSIENTLRKLCDGQINIEISEIINYFRDLKARDRADKTLLIIDNFNDDETEDNQAEYQHELQNDLFSSLAGTGINILLTTRINVQSDCLKISELKEIKKHFLELSNVDKLADKEEERIIDRFIHAVDSNTMLVTLVANAYKEMTQQERMQFLEHLETNQIEKVIYPVPQVGGYGREKFYDQLSKIFRFSSVLRKKERVNVLASAVLLPSDGIDKDVFIDMLPKEWRDALVDMTDRSWITDDDKKIMVHAGIRAVARQNSDIMKFDNCKPYYYAINKKIDMDYVSELDKRIHYYGCAAEIFKVFNNLSNIPDDSKESMLWLYYNLSDLCDHLKEKRLAKELCELVADNINMLKDKNDVRIGQIMCGIAYSLIQEAEKIDNLSKPNHFLEGAEKLLDSLKKTIEEMPEECIEEKWYFRKIEGQLLSNQGALMQKRAMILRKEAGQESDKAKEAQAKNFFKKAEKKHHSAAKCRYKLWNDMKDKLDDKQICQLENNLAKSYKNIATEQYHLGKFLDARENHLEAIRIFEKTNSRNNLAISQFLVAGCVLEACNKRNLRKKISMDMIAEALDQLCNSLRIFYENKNYEMLNKGFQKLDEFHHLINRETQLQSLAEKAAKMCDEMEAFRCIS